MDVNYEVWGTPETWVDGDNTQQQANIKFAESAHDTLGEAWTTGRVPWNTVDLSAAYWGISKDSMWAHPHQVWGWSEDGQTSDFEVGEGELLSEAVNIPAIFTGAGSDSSCPISYTRRWKYRVLTEQSGIPGNAYSRKVFMDFNYQKVMIVPYVICKPADWAPSHSTGNISQSDNISFVDYFDNDGYINRPQILGFGYRCRFGDGSTTRVETASFGLVDLLIDAPGHSGYESKAYFAGPDGSSFATHNIVGYSVIPQDITFLNVQGDGTVGDSDTGFRWAYSPTNTGNSVRFYYYDDDPLWEINKSVYVYSNNNYWAAYPRILCTAANKTAAKAYAMKQIAYLGLPFVIDPETAKTGKIGDTGVYLPKFDEDGITTGEYEEGATALTLPNAEWIDGRTGSGYDPTKPTPGGDGDEGIKVRPSTPAFTLAGHGTKCYALIESDIDEIFDDIYGRSSSSWSKLIKGLQMFGADPMGAIISFKWYPFSFSSTTNSAVYLGNTAINPLHQYPVIDSTGNSYKSTTATYKWDVDRNFVNSRKTTCRLYLPFYGFYELPLPLIISKTLSVYMAYNVPDELATWIISFDDVVYDFVECDPSIDIPLTGSNAAQIALTKRNTALSIATQVGATAAAIAVGATMQAPALGAAIGELGAIYSGAGTIGGVIQSLPWLEASSVRALAAGGAAAAGIGAGGVASGANILNRISNAKMQIGHLMTNLPYHGAASSTTFLNLPMYPYIQFIQNVKMQGWNEAEYKIKVGIACDKWVTTSSMPADSLLQTTGIANMPVNDLELAEVQELNEILQSGFCK